MVEDLLTDSLEDEIKKIEDIIESDVLRPLEKWSYYMTLLKLKKQYHKEQEITLKKKLEEIRKKESEENVC